MTTLAARVAAQAKLNLHLRVLAREDSGFHSIETVFHRIDLADDVSVTITPAERSIEVEGLGTGSAERNLAYRAALAYAAHAGWPSGFRIGLTKKIPVGAGLGGGSSDAAAVLRILNFLSPQPMPAKDLLRVAAGLGSDVPFLASDSVMALAWGRGDRMLAFNPLPRRDILLMTPEFAVSTADAYRWLDEDREGGSAAPEPVAFDPLSLSTWGGLERFAQNDFEAPVCARHPRLEGYLEALRRSRSHFAMMTGSGSTIFGALESPPQFAKVPAEHRAQVTATKTSIDVVQPVRLG